jgi:DnaJ-domain-containing protein 1
MFDDIKSPKVKLDTEILLEDGTKLLAAVFTNPQARLSDLMNDEREFLPIELIDGRTTVVRKSAIMQVTPVEQDLSAYESTDPYELLGVDSSAGYESVRESYVAMLKGCHPDSLAAYDLPTPLVLFANNLTARLNQAFHQICRDRGWEAKAED